MSITIKNPVGRWASGAVGNLFSCVVLCRCCEGPTRWCLRCV